MSDVGLQPVNHTDYDPEIAVAAQEHGLPVDLLTALVLCESSGYADAFRHEAKVWPWFHRHPKAAGLNARRAGSSYGLCQVLYPTATDYGFEGEPEELFKPRVSLEYGARVLSELLKWAKGDERKALEAYNGGKGNVGSIQTQAYAQRVLRRKLTL